MRRLLLFAFLLAACDAEELPPVCSGDPPCPPPSPLLQWAAAFQPPANPPQGMLVPLLPQEEPVLVFSTSGNAQLHFTQPPHLRGSVLDENGTPIPRAHVVALLPSAIPGQSSSSFETATDNQGAFSLRVPLPQRPMDQRYHIWVGFDDPAEAARRTPMWQNDVVVAQDVQVTLKARKASELFVVRGTVLDLFGGVGGMRLQVMDDKQQIVSTTVISQQQDSDQGAKGSFSVLVDPNLSPNSMLQLVAQPGTQMSGVPVLSQPLQIPDAGNTVTMELHMPPYKNPVPFTLTVRGTGTSGATMAVPGARVQAQVYLPDPLFELTRSLYSVSGETDRNGEVVLPLVPPTGESTLYYTVLVQSPARSDFASSGQQVAVGGDGGTIMLSLPLRAQISGRLLSSDGQPVAGAQVLALGISSTESGSSLLGGLLMASQMPQTTSDPNGRFALRLDPGDYDLDFVPVAGTQPRFSLDNQRLLTDDVELGFVHLPGPTLGRIWVLRPDGAPVEGATVNVYQLPDTTPRLGGACDVLRPCSRAAKLRAEAATDSQGRAAVLLPD